eukprot:SAG11_NODE_23973_length_380_cov_0.736655_1_plen_30_part_01
MFASNLNFSLVFVSSLHVAATLGVSVPASG